MFCIKSLTFAGAIINMQRLISDERLFASTFGSTPCASVKARLVSMLQAVMLSMQQQLQLLRENDEAHKGYVTFVQGIASQIHSHASEICPLIPFFSQATADYWPEPTDPSLYLAKLTSYALQLQGHNRTNTSLFYFLWSGFKKSLLDKDVDIYISRVAKVARKWNFLEYLLTDLIPAASKVTFDNQAGWLICEVFLVAASRAIPSFLSSARGEQLFDLMKDLFKQFMNGLSALYETYNDGIYGFHPDHRGIIAVICRFWQSCLPALKNYTIRAAEDMDEVFVAFNEVMEIAMINFENGPRLPLGIRCFHVRRMGNDKATDALSKEVGRDWNVNMNDGSLRIRLREGGEEKLIEFNMEIGPRTLREVLALSMSEQYSSDLFGSRREGGHSALNPSSRFLSIVF